MKADNTSFDDDAGRKYNPDFVWAQREGGTVQDYVILFDKVRTRFVAAEGCLMFLFSTFFHVVR